MSSRRLIKNRKARPRREGAAALEFAIVATPFFMMIFAILELGLVFLVDSVLENATLEASRTIRTGQAQGGGATAATFKTALCDRMSVFSADCRTRADVDVRELPQFRNPNPPNPIQNGVMDRSALTFDPGDPGSIILIRVWYSQPLITPFLSQAMTRLTSGQTVLQVATAFRNEPYGD